MKTLGLIFFALALVAELGGLLLWYRMKRKSQKGVTAQATVLERIMLGSGERDTVLIVEYQNGERTVKAKVNAAHADFDVAPGDTVEIGYDPQRAGDVVLRTVKCPVSVFVVGVIAFLMGLFFYVLG
jgi:hypothetical protein